MSWICAKCERELFKENQIHFCARVSVDSLFEGKPMDLVLVFDKILAEVSGWEGVLVSTTPNCIVFVRHKTFLVVRPMQKVLDVKFYSEVAIQRSPILNSVLYAGKYANNVRLKSVDELKPEIFKMIWQSYKML